MVFASTIAAFYGKLKAIVHLLTRRANIRFRDLENSEVLHYALCSGSPESCVVPLLSYGAEMDTREDDGNTPLHYACFVGLRGQSTFLSTVPS
jgi:ankyrin repeat protein